MQRYLITAALVLLIALLAGWYQPAPLPPAHGWARLTGLLASLVLLCLFVERAVEVVLSALRGGGADRLDLALAQANSGSDEHRRLARERMQYRAHSRLIAQQLALVAGLLLALAGVRILALLTTEPPGGWQGRLFDLLDILLTGAVIAGGSDAANKFTKAYGQLMASLCRSRSDAE